MRLASFDSGGHPCAALLRDDRVYDIWGDALAHVRDDDRTLEAILEGGLLEEVRPVDGDDGVPVDGVRLLPPVTRPAKIICIGLNYRAHAEEQGAEPPETPTSSPSSATRWRRPERRSNCRRGARRWTTRQRSRS